MINSEPISVVPCPADIRVKPGQWRLPKDGNIHVDPDFPVVGNAMRLLQDRLRQSAGFELPIGSTPESAQTAAIVFRKASAAVMTDEQYQLDIDPERVTITASSGSGAFYGVQTLLQLLSPDIFCSDGRSVPWEAACLFIQDQPRFRWRGAHLDVSRHFFEKDAIFRYLDILAFHKINTFHFHLTDDQGWRIQIMRYPRLTEIGAWRVDREEQDWNHRDDPRPDEPASYGGFYTQDDIRAIVKYASERCIQVIPEIEMPGHTMAALVAYPELSCAGGPFAVPPGQYWPITNLLCAGNEKTFEFLEHVLGEVCELFPAPFVHIGGDEADTTEWARCPKCQNRMQEQQRDAVGQLQSYFIGRVSQILRKFGKRAIGWDEILTGDLDAQAMVMSWRGVSGGIAAAQQNHDVIMCPVTHCYFDHYQGDPATEPQAFGGNTPLSKVYEFNPLPAELTPAEQQHILGAQVNLWTEFVTTPSHLEYMLLPRLAALSEATWCEPALRSWSRFTSQLPALFQRYENQRWNFSRKFA
jgi:hexosaminidase